MLTGITIVFLGGDARQVEVINKCLELDATVRVVGFDRLETPLKGVSQETLSPGLLTGADVIILPVIGCDDHGVIPAPFSAEQLVIKQEWFAAIRKSTLVYTGIAKSFLKQMGNEHGFQIIEVLDRDDVAIYNSIPTAEGAVMMAIQNTDITIHGSTCIVLGIGRTGFTLAATLQGLGANVRVGVRREDDVARAVQMGWKPFATRDLAANVGDVDLIFNTIPTMIVTAQIISKLPRTAVIIDLASAPGGTDFRFAEKRGVKAILAPGIPGIVAPKTAGIIMANTICQSILDEFQLRGDEQ
ncbi:MAG: dipicolinate synthase subunit DpsA [Paenibacillaceae bacterium]|uniref:Dipicolinate synthase subunit DpsA n=1 Tax=Paenibacillus mellifer TaxID=2937794 RepID=A0A9X1XZM1_9BACL|nr:dipicolinate synthase subunit DpsA [Paenibacillus mellifer]MBW4840527.1 dipicolinate synthase subunit DpsA [Paenibacillaceae bacterium]MCK8488655.1 dipicolinate synthase subunit DpsA [Paenibacillus mellifer]